MRFVIWDGPKVVHECDSPMEVTDLLLHVQFGRHPTVHPKTELTVMRDGRDLDAEERAQLELAVERWGLDPEDRDAEAIEIGWAVRKQQGTLALFDPAIHSYVPDEGRDYERSPAGVRHSTKIERPHD